MDLRTATDAVVGAIADVIVGGFAAAMSSYDDVRAQGEALRNQAAGRALLGAALYDALPVFVDGVTRRAAERFESIRLHPRYSRDALVNELDDAEVMLAKELLAAQGETPPAPSLGLLLALIRVRAISAATGETPIAGRPTARAAGGAPVQRRRPMTAADIPEEVAQQIFAASRGDGMASALDRLGELELTTTNAGAIVSKVKVALERHGVRKARTLANALRDAGVAETVPDADAAADARPDVAPARKGLELSPTPPVLSATPRQSIAGRIKPKHKGSPGGRRSKTPSAKK